MSKDQDDKTPMEEMVDSTMMLATLVRAYYENLKLNGFDDKSALYLAMGYQNTVLNMSTPKRPGEPNGN